jgi:hypothetical protein
LTFVATANMLPGLRQLPRRCRTLKRDEHDARFFLHQETSSTKNESPDLAESRADMRVNDTTDNLAGSVAAPPN